MTLRIFIPVLLAIGLATATAEAALVSAWRAENNVLDAIDGNSGIAQGALSYTSGVSGQSFHFNGTDAGISVPYNANLNMMAGDFSIAAWVRFTGAFSIGPSLFLAYWGVQTYQLGFNPAGRPYLNFRDAEADNVDVLGTTALNDGVWHHIVGVRSGTTGQLYVDGALTASTTNPSSGTVNVTGITYARIGWSATDGTNLSLNANATARYTGDLDELELYNHALSAGDIATLANLVPEPASLALLSAALGLLAYARRI